MTHARYLASLICWLATSLLGTTGDPKPFEGTITIDISTHGMTTYDSLFHTDPKDKQSSVVVSYKGDKFVMRSLDSLVMYGDHARKTFVLMKQGAQGGMQMDLLPEGHLRQDNAEEPTVVDRSGVTKTINGWPAEQFTIRSDAAGESDWWMTKAIPVSQQEAVLSTFWHSAATAKAIRRNDYFGAAPVEELLDSGYVPVEMDTKYHGAITSIMKVRSIEATKINDASLDVPSGVQIMTMPSH